MQARADVRDGFKEREVARLESTIGIWTGKFNHINYYAARRNKDTEVAGQRKRLPRTRGIRSSLVRNLSGPPIYEQCAEAVKDRLNPHDLHHLSHLWQYLPLCRNARGRGGIAKARRLRRALKLRVVDNEFHACIVGSLCEARRPRAAEPGTRQGQAQTVGRARPALAACIPRHTSTAQLAPAPAPKATESFPHIAGCLQLVGERPQRKRRAAVVATATVVSNSNSCQYLLARTLSRRTPVHSLARKESARNPRFRSAIDIAHWCKKAHAFPRSIS